MKGYCRICGGFVEREGHTHAEKECEICHIVKKLQDFPVHFSSMDGHRHTCIECANQKKEKPKAIPRQTRFQQRSQKARERERLNVYGYRWKKEMEEWVLYSPTKQRIDIARALQEIMDLQVHTPGHPSTLWARSMLNRSDVLVLDTETTGFNDDDEVIDIALVDTTGQIRLNTLVECQHENIPQGAYDVHGIHKKALRGSPSFPQLWKRLAPTLATHEIIIYHAEYDLRLLKQTCQRYDLDFPEIRSYCLMKQYAAYVGQMLPRGEDYRNFKLAAACLHFQVEQEQAHRALVDALTSLDVLRGLAFQDGRNEVLDDLF